MSQSGCPLDLRLLYTASEGAYAFVKINNRDLTLANALKALFLGSVDSKIVEKHRASVKNFVLSEFEHGCDGFPCYGKSPGVNFKGTKVVLYGTYQRKGKGNNITGFFLRCQERTSVDFKFDAPDTCFDLQFKFDSSLPQPTESTLEPTETTTQCVCLLGCEFSTVKLSDLVYRICGLHGSDEALIQAIAPEYSIFKSLLSNTYRESNKSVDIEQESDYHAIVRSKHKKVVKVHCGMQHESINVTVLEHCAERTVNGVTREAVDKRYSATAYLASPQASRMFHKDCWKEHKRRFLKTTFTTPSGEQPSIVECLACSKAGCEPFSVLAPAAAVTVIKDIPMYSQALPMFLMLRMLGDATCSFPDVVPDEDARSSAKRTRVDEDSDSDEEVVVQVRPTSPQYCPTSPQYFP